MLDIDLNMLPLPHADESTEELSGVQTENEDIAEISSEPSILPVPAAENSSSTKKKVGRPRVSPIMTFTGEMPKGLPDGWVVDERMRLSGQLAGGTYKHFVEPGTGKVFRSLASVLRHIGLPPKPLKNKPKKSPARNGANSLKELSE